MPLIFHGFGQRRKKPKPYQAPSSRSSSEHASRPGTPREEHEDAAAPPSPSTSGRSTASGSISPGTADQHERASSSNPPSAKPPALGWAIGGEKAGHGDHGSALAPASHIAWDPRKHPRGSPNEDDCDDQVPCRRPRRAKTFHMRAFEDDEDTDWWFASTACPLIAAATTPLANMLSIAALVTPWRVNLSDGHGGLVPDFAGSPYHDPRW
jgi:hypothetical protein